MAVKDHLEQKNIIVRKSKTHGYGVFATKNIRKGTLIEECYILVTRRNDPGFMDYLFNLGKGNFGILLGFGCIYNHCSDPNADYTFNIKKRIAKIKAKRFIKKGDEIFIDYGDEYFKSRDADPS